MGKNPNDFFRGPDKGPENPKHVQALKDGKAPLEYLVSSVNPGEAWVLKGGADKYGIRNWLVDKIKATTYLGAIRRHLDDWAAGSNADKDSGQHPLQHVRACCAVVLDADLNDTLIDDRGRKESFDKKVQAELLTTVTYTTMEINNNEIEILRTETFGPFTTRSDAVEFVRKTRGQMTGTASFNTIQPVPEIQNDRDRNQEVNVSSDNADRGIAPGKITSDECRLSRSEIGAAFRRLTTGED